MFFKHPSVYFEATIANSYYYYCANIVGSIEPIYVDNIYVDEYTEKLGLAGKESHIQARAEMSEFLASMQEKPVLSLFFSEGFYTYLLIGMMGFLAYINRKRYMLGLLPSMIGVLVCIASPVLGSFRYFLPVIACTCICLAFCLKCKEKQQNA